MDVFIHLHLLLTSPCALNNLVYQLSFSLSLMVEDSMIDLEDYTYHLDP